jgi:hypothetical protein
MCTTVSHHYITWQKLELCILVFLIFDSRKAENRLWAEREQIFPELITFLISKRMEYLFVKAAPKDMNFAALAKDLFAVFIS